MAFNNEMIDPAQGIAADEDSSEALVRRAAALINPASGLANDYLNVFNEIVMLIELRPSMPAISEDIAAWHPIHYRDYFLASTLPGRHVALRAWSDLEPGFRSRFETHVTSLDALVQAAIRTILEFGATNEPESDMLERYCEDAGLMLRSHIELLTDFVNLGSAARVKDPQAIADELFNAA